MIIPTYETILSQMREEYRARTGFLPDKASDLEIRFKVLAEEISKLWQSLSEISDSTFPETASGQSLENRARERGLFRKQGSYASGSLRFSRSYPASYDITIPAGIVCTAAGSENLRVTTTEEVTLTAGQLYVDAVAVADEIGEEYNIASGIINAMVNPPPEISEVSNNSAFSGGSDSESDDMLRERLLSSYYYISNGANSAYYLEQANKFDAVHSSAVLPLTSGSNTVNIILDGFGASLSEDDIDEIQDHFDEVCALGVEVEVAAADEAETDITLTIAPADGYTIAELEESVSAAISNYISSMMIAQPLLISKLIGRVISLEGVENCEITSPSADEYILPDEVIRLGELTITEMAVS